MPCPTRPIPRDIKAKALREAKYLAGEFARAASVDREHILAALEFEQWLAEGCDMVLPNG